MKTKQTIITHGQYDSYRIIDVVEGAFTPAVSTLYKQFREQWGLSNKPGKSSRDIMARVEAEILAEGLLANAGYRGDNLGEQFVAWLVAVHGYTRVKLAEINING